MGLKPGESDCSLCVKRPLAEGGAGTCPMRGAIYFIHKQRRDCTAFVEQGHLSPLEEKRLKLEPQTEALF